ncbi:hypothetical protein G7046_g9369 [Stylonectria norvegica]|nr:hypothetical protein G7046_g9369 [Stylonectria norvegica]
MDGSMAWTRAFWMFSIIKRKLPTTANCKGQSSMTKGATETRRERRGARGKRREGIELPPWTYVPSTMTIKFLNPKKLGAASESWLRHDGRTLEWTAATWRYFFWNKRAFDSNDGGGGAVTEEDVVVGEALEMPPLLLDGGSTAAASVRSVVSAGVLLVEFGVVVRREREPLEWELSRLVAVVAEFMVELTIREGRRFVKVWRWDSERRAE